MRSTLGTLRSPLSVALLAASLLLVAPSSARAADTSSDSASGAASGTPPSVCDLAPLPSSAALTTLRARIASAATQKVRLLALGSSTTYGMDLDSLSERWPDRFMQGLADRGVNASPISLGQLDPKVLSQAPGAVMVDGAVPGALAETSLAEDLPGLLASELSGNGPTIVLHMIGANDYWLQDPPALFGTALSATAAALDVQPVRPIQVFISTYRDPATTDPKIPWSAYSDQMRAVAAQDPTHRIFLDLAPWFDAAGVPGADPEGLLDSGGVHPSVAGQQTMADLILRALGYGC